MQEKRKTADSEKRKAKAVNISDWCHCEAKPKQSQKKGLLERKGVRRLDDGS